MDKSSKESIAQSEIEDSKESALHDSITDDKDSANDSASSTVEDLSTSESCKDSSDPNDESTSSNVSEGEAEFKITEVIESNSYATENVMGVATRQASDSLVSTSSTTSGEKTQSLEPFAIPSTSKDSSESAHAAENSPKRPTNFGRNVKQAIHIFYPINPKAILMKVPIPIHSGRWVYLRDSPESSDYGGSTDTLDDPLLMEALDGEIPEVEIEDAFTPRNEEMPSCPPPIENPMLDDDSPAEEGAVGGLLNNPGHSEIIFENAEGDHAKRNTGDYLQEPSSKLEETVEDKPIDTENRSLSSDSTIRTFEKPTL